MSDSPALAALLAALAREARVVNGAAPLTRLGVMSDDVDPVPR